MHQKKWLSFILVLALVVTSFVSMPIASYADGGGSMYHQFMEGVTFTKAGAAGTPASLPFDGPPGSGAPVILPDLGSAPGSDIPGFYVTKNHYNCWAIVSGYTAEDAEVEFSIPETPAKASWLLQLSTDSGITWIDCNGGATYSRADYYSSITTEPDWYSYPTASYRLNRVGTSVYTIEADVAAPTVLTEFTGWGYSTGMNSQYVGGTPTIITGGASFIGVNDVSDIALQDENIIYTWYRVNPVTYEMTPIPGESGTGAEYWQYTTTAADIGYKILCRIDGDGTTVGGYMQTMVLGTPISVPVKGYVSNASGNSFVLNLESDVALTKDDLSVETYEGTPCAISAVTSVSGGSVYAVTMSGDPNGYSAYGTSQKFTVSSEKSGVIIGQPWTPPAATDLTPNYSASSPAVMVNSESDGDQVYPEGSNFSCMIQVPASVATPGATVRVAFGSMESSGSIAPFVDSAGNSIDPFGTLTLETSAGKYYYKSATVDTYGTISFSGTVASGICPSALGIIIADGTSGYAISGMTPMTAGGRQVLFGIDNALPSSVESYPQFKDINNFYSIPGITFSAVMIDQDGVDNDVTGSLAFSNLNMMEDWSEIMQLGSSMTFQPAFDGSTPAGFSLGMDDTKLVKLASNAAVISVSNIDVLQTMLNGGEAFTLADFEITGSGVISNENYSNGNLSFDVNHFSNYDISFADQGGGGTPATVNLTGISLQKQSTSLEVDATETLAVDFTPTNATNKTLAWATSDSAIATVDSTGKVTAVNAGIVTISAIAQDGGYTDSCLVTVNEPSNGASVEGLNLVYFNNQNEQKSITVGGFSSGQYFYTSTIHDDISLGTLIGLGTKLAAGSGATVSAVTFGALDADLHAHSYVEITEEDFTTYVYEVEITGDASGVDIDDCSDNTFVVGYPSDYGMRIWLTATEEDGTPCDPLSLGALTVDYVAGDDRTTLTPGSIYFYNSDASVLTFSAVYLSSLPAGEHFIDVVLTNAETHDEYSVRTSIYVLPATSHVFFSDPDDGALTVYQHTGWDIPGTRGAIVVSGGAVTVGGDKNAEINCTVDPGYRISSAAITENYYGDSHPYDETGNIVRGGGTILWDPWGDAYISIETEPIPSTLPAIEGIELYKLNDTTGEYEPVTSTMTGISVNDQLRATVLYDENVDVSTNVFADYLWQDMLRDSGTYSMDSILNCSPPDEIYLKDVAEYVSDNYVKLTVSSIPNYTTGDDVSVEFFVNSGLPSTAVTGISVAPTTLTMAVGAQETLMPQITPENAGNKAVTWETSDDSVATVDSSGVVSAVSVGHATVSAITSDGGFKSDCSVTVVANAVSISGITANNKPYDGTTAASITGTPVLNGKAPSDDVSITGTPVASFADKNAGTDKAVSVSGYTLTGADAAKYTLTSISLKADISKLTLTAAAVNQTKGLSEPNPTPSLTYDGFITGENAANSGITAPTASHTASLNSPVGSYDILVADGSGGLNYNLVTVNGTLTVVRSDIPLTGISLQKHSTELVIGTTETLAVDFTPANASIKTLTWGTSDAAIATVDSTGKVTAVKAGMVTISAIAQDGGYADSCLVTVTAPIITVSGVTVNPTTLTLAVGAQETLTPQVTPQNANEKAVAWSTSNDTVATVDSSGLVSAVSVGHATVSAITSDGAFKADCSVTVVANAVSISGITANNKPYDGTTAASITGTPVLNGVKSSGGVAVVGTAVAAFADKNAGVGKDVFVSGYTLTGPNAGNYSLTSISLKANITKLTLTAAAVNQTKGQNTPNPTPSITYAGFITGETAANSGITAPTASHTASLNAPVGSYDINVTSGNGGSNYNMVMVKGTLTVIRSDIPLTGISLQKHSIELVTGTTETLAVDFTPTSASIKTLKWATSDAAIATVDNTGKVTAVKAGTVTISAIADDGGFADSCVVTVMTPISLTSTMTYNDNSAISSAAGIYNVDGKKYPVYDANFLSETNKPLKLTLYGSGTEIKDQTQYSLVMSLDNKPEFSQTLTTSGAILKSGVPVDVRRIPQMGDGSHSLVIVVKDGTATKSAITINLSITGSIVPVTGISLPLSQLSLIAGETYQLKATVTPSNASDKNVLWSTSNSAIATVSGGAVTAVGAGTTTISAITNHRGYTATATVNVGAKITGKLLKDGAAQPYSYLYLYQGSNYVAGVSSDSNGNFTFKNVKVGSYSITASSPGTGYADITTDVAISVGDAIKTVGDLNYVSAYSNKSTLTINIQDQSGNPYSGSSDVYIYLYSYETGYSTYRTATAAEKAGGAATLTNVPYATAGTNYDLSISTNDYWDYRSVTFDSATETATFSIPVRYSISGKLLRDSDFSGTGDTAVPFSYVMADAGGWNTYYGYTDAQGNYTITGLDPGNYTLQPYETTKYNFTPSAVTVATSNLTNQNITVTKGADLVGHVYKGSTDAYKAYVMLKDNNDQYLAGSTAGSSGFILDGAVKAPGTYKLQLSYVMDKNGTYPMFVCSDVTFAVTAEDIAAGRISQNITYTDPTNASDIFVGDGNTVVTDISVVRSGSTANLIIKYKNNGNTTVTASFGAIMPTGVTADSASFTVNNLAAGASGQKSILLTIGNVATTYINIPVKVEIDGQSYDFGSASLEMAGITLSGPGAVKTNEAFRVYGEATANSTIVIKDAITGKFYASVKPNGRWYSSAITLTSEGTANLIAEVTASGGGASAVSTALSVSATAEQLAIENVKSDSAGMSELPVNKIIGARAFTAWVDSHLNGRDISIATLFDKNIVSSMTYHFSGNDYTATKGSDGYYSATLNNWSGGGLKTITATVNTTDGRTLTFIIAEVTVLIDPSGYVTDDETGDRLSGVTVICETTNDSGATWSTWNAELYGQINPQTTDSEGNYGWMVPAGTYRVRAMKTGYDGYLTSDIVIPPVRTDVNFALGPEKPMTGITLNSDELSVNVGATSQLTATAVPSDANNAAQIEWRSQNSSIATVSSNGLVTGKVAGSTTITAYFTKSGSEITADCAVTVAAVTHSDPGPNPSPSTPQGPEIKATKADKVTIVKTTIEGTVSGTTATAPVSKETIASMLDSVKQAENSGQKARMEFSVTAPSSATEVKLEIPKSSFSQIVSDTNADVSVKAPLATLTFDEKAVQTVNNAGAGDISINIAKVDTAQLSNEAKELVGDRPVFDFAVKSGSTAVTNFNGGNVSVSIPYTLGAGEDPEAVVVYYIDSTGSPKAIKGAYNSSTGTIDFTTTHFSKYAVGYNKVAFTDVSANAWYGDAVTFLAARGITTGTSEGVFSPSAKLTRAQFLVMALRAYGIEADTDTSGNFSDAGSTYYTGYLAAAKRLGISNGDGKGHFLPNAQITRQDMFVLLYRTLDVLGELPEAQSASTVAQFKDAAKVSAYATDAMNALIQANVVSGSNGSLDPKGLSSRAQMAQVLYNLLAK